MIRIKKLALITTGIIVISIILIAGYSPEQKDQQIDCTSLKQSFDEYIEKSTLPIIEDPDSLCHGLNMGSDFSKLPPRWAVGKLIKISGESVYSFTFEGINETGIIQVPLDNSEVHQYEIGKHYKIDMNNICRSFFMIVDSRYPSPISSTFVKPVVVNCK